MQLGVFSLTDLTGAVTPSRRVRDVVDVGVHADQAGLDVFGVGEHHTPRFAVSSPAVVLAAIAARTSTITLTSAVSVLSVLDPVRLHQDFAQLDLVSGGRAEVTAGRSAYTEPFDIFGVPLADYDAVFEEKLDLLLRVRTGAPVTWAGHFRAPLDQAVITPHLSRPLPVRLGVGGTPASAARAARAGLPMTVALLGGSVAQLRPVIDRYWEVGAQHGHLQEDLSVGVASHFFVGSTSQGARETFYPHYRSYFADGRGQHLSRSAFEEMASPDGALVVGSPAEVAEKVLRQQELLGSDRFMGQVDLGGLPQAAVLSSIDRFAHDVAPIVRREHPHHTR